MNEPVAPMATKRTPYPGRWAGFGPDERARIAGDPDTAAELDDLLDQLGDMTEEQRAQTIEAWYRRLEAIRVRLEVTEAHERRLRQQRRLLFAQLLLAGEVQAQVATRAGVSSPIVGTETGISTKQR